MGRSSRSCPNYSAHPSRYTPSMTRVYVREGRGYSRSWKAIGYVCAHLEAGCGHIVWDEGREPGRSIDEENQ